MNVQTMSFADKLTAAAAIVCVMVFACASSLILPVLTLTMESRGESSITIGAFGAMLGLTAMGTTFFVPSSVRRFGARRVLFVALLTTAAAMLCYPLLREWREWLLAWFIIYIIYCAALGFVFVVAESVITAAAPKTRRGLILGIYATCFSAGFALGPFVLVLTGVEGWLPFVAGASFAITGALLVAVGVRGNATPQPKHVSGRKMAGYFAGMARALPLPFAAAVAVGAIEISIYDFLPVYASKLDYEVEDAVLLLSAFSVGSLVVVPLICALADRYQKEVFLCTVLLSLVGAMSLPWLVLGVRDGGEIYWLCLGCWGGVLMALYPLGLVKMSRALPPADLVGGNSLFGLSYGLGAFMGPLCAGLAMEVQVHFIAIALAVFALLPLFWLREKRNKDNLGE